MPVTIREARLDDAEQLLAHVDRLSREPDLNLPLAPGEFDLTLEEERYILADYAVSANSVFLVAEADGQIIGVLHCKGGDRQATRHVAKLSISVHKEWRGQGIGTRLIERAIAWAKDTGIVKRVEAYVYAPNEPAICICEKCGFKVEGRRQRSYYQHGQYIDDLLMALLL